VLASWQTLEADSEPAAHVASCIAAAIQSALRANGVAFIALCGGRTPRAAYAELARQSLEWQKVTVVPTDERCVAPTHEHSNEGMLRTALLSGAASAAQLVSLWSGAATPAQAAIAASQRLADWPQPFDFELLGMGADGHIASLFPAAAQLAAAINPASGEQVAAIVPGPGAPPPAVARLTLTLPRLLNARRICLLIAGKAKRELLLKVMQSPDVKRWPVSALFLPGAPAVDVIWIEGEI
jgi:6-phosphogluconolactonase